MLNESNSKWTHGSFFIKGDISVVILSLMIDLKSVGVMHSKYALYGRCSISFEQQHQRENIILSSAIGLMK
jgi:hypothetical protein